MKYMPGAMTLLLLLPNGSLAAGNGNAKVLLHLASTTNVQACTRAEAHPACSDVVTAGGLYPGHLYYAYLLVADGNPVNGVSGALMGIDYDSGTSDGVGVDVFSWTLCASIELQVSQPVWPAAGASSRIYWDTTTRCQRNEPGGAGTGVVGTLGYFYCAAYSAASFRVKEFTKAGDPYNHKVALGDCNGLADVIYDATNPPVPSPLGSVMFSESGTETGYNPCQQVIPVKPSTWSGVKTQFH